MYFREVQQFRQGWLWALLALQALVVVTVFGHGMYRQFFLGEPWGNRPMTNIGLAVAGAVSLLVVVSLVALFSVLKLVTEVRNDGLHIRFFPLSRQVIPFDTIRKCEVRQYSPIREYGGWGIRYGRKGKAYNVSGNCGVQIELAKGRPLLIGSQRPEELARAILMRMGR